MGQLHTGPPETSGRLARPTFGTTLRGHVRGLAAARAEGTKMAAEQGRDIGTGRVPGLNTERIYTTTVPPEELAQALADHSRAQGFEAQGCSVLRWSPWGSTGPAARPAAGRLKAVLAEPAGELSGAADRAQPALAGYR